ncbi:MAG: porphobilinogen synthase [Bacteroidetes bacterium]|nr:porphobilinogen synthase [Bacteroidota bacterium]
MHIRPRRLRATASMRRMATEHQLTPANLIAPIFIIEGEQIREEISSMPGYYRYSLDLALNEIAELKEMGVPAVLLFVKVDDGLKDNKGSEAVNPDGLMQRSIRAIKKAVSDITVMTDVALDPYSSYGHDGIVEDGEIVNDRTVQVLAQMAVSHAQAGADAVAPSDMMDGRVAAIREALEISGHPNTAIMAYSAKYASCFYGPFRDALDSAPGFGDKKTYQMNPANIREAIRETLLDIEEGADIVMVKPGVPYLDVVRAIREVADIPVAAYHVSGEYAMIKAASAKGWLNQDQAIMETMLSFRRAGADLIATYFCRDVIRLLKNS